MASSPALLKQQAAALELKKQPEKALALYQQLLAEHGGTPDVDVALRNRVGDLHLRVGQVDEAIALFEKSADEYALSGFLNNAIALCNKILRHRPGHVGTLRRLARFSAEKGMVVDAQRHYLSVAEALERLGQHTEALQALSEFAELSPEDVHVRSVVVEQLLRAGRKPDALPHLTVLHRLHVVAGRMEEADGVAQVAREIDELWIPESSEELTDRRVDPSLVFIDSDDDFGALETSPMLSVDREPARPEGLELSNSETTNIVPTDGVLLEGFESNTLDESVPQAEVPAFDLPSAVPSAEIDFLDIDSQGADAAPAVLDEPDAPTMGAFSGAADFDEGFDLEASAALEAPQPEAFEMIESLPASTAAPDPTPETVVSDDLLPPVIPAEPIDEPPAPAPSFRPKRPTPTYINLADILRDDEPKSSRMTIDEPVETGDVNADFQNLLQEFRDEIEKTIPVDDANSHYDLGIAFREMGLIDDAISEFQISSRSPSRRVDAIEALGGCFLTKKEPAVAKSLLLRALDDPTVAHGDDTLRGVLYLLGQASEALGARDDGLRYYQRVYAVDIRFRDVAARIQTLQQPV